MKVEAWATFLTFKESRVFLGNPASVMALVGHVASRKYWRQGASRDGRLTEISGR